jgi:hypothetical protein
MLLTAEPAPVKTPEVGCVTLVSISIASEQNAVVDVLPHVIVADVSPLFFVAAEIPVAGVP